MKKKNTIIREEARKCYGDLLNYTKFNLTLNHHDAEDLVSQTYIRFFNSYDKGRSKYKKGTNILGYLNSEYPLKVIILRNPIKNLLKIHLI